MPYSRFQAPCGAQHPESAMLLPPPLHILRWMKNSLHSTSSGGDAIPCQFSLSSSVIYFELQWRLLQAQAGQRLTCFDKVQITACQCTLPLNNSVFLNMCFLAHHDYEVLVIVVALRGSSPKRSSSSELGWLQARELQNRAF